MKIFGRALLLIVMMMHLSCSGGGDNDDWLFPLWVPTDIVVTDIDGDGRNDVITLSKLSTSMSHEEGCLLVYRQESPGVFKVPDTYVVGFYPWKLVVGDVDVDGYPDLLVTDPDGRCVWLLIQNQLKRGRFLPPQQVASGIYTYEAAIADLSGDGAPDIAIADNQKDSKRLVLRYQDPVNLGTFLPAVDFTLVGTASNLTAGDIDGDGRADLFMQSGGGAFAFAGFYEMPISVSRVTAGDIDGDGLNDLVVLGGENQCLVMIQSHTAPGTFNAPRQLL